MRPVASDADRALLRNLYPLYIHELSRFTDFYRLDGRGVWQPDLLTDWLGAAHRLLLLAWVDDRPAGFLFAGTRPFPHFRTDGAEHHLAELFVVAPERERGVGRDLAEAAFARWSGRWELSVLAGNAGALAFWRRVLAPLGPAEGPGTGDIVFTMATA